MQFSTLMLAALPAVMALPLAPRQESTDQVFTMICSHSDSPVHQLPIQARGYALWVGGGNAANCPSDIQDLDCSQFSNETAFTASPGAPTGVAMDVEVAGGQQLFISPTGSVNYTIQHSGYIPPGSIADGFNYTAPVGDENGSFLPYGNGSTDWFACPLTADTKTTGPWQVFANVAGVQYPTGNVEDCYDVGLIPESNANDTTPATWQYE